MRMGALAALAWILAAPAGAPAQTVTFNGQTVDLNTLPPEVQEKIRSGEIKLPPGAVMSGGPGAVGPARPPRGGNRNGAAQPPAETKPAEGEAPKAEEASSETVKRPTDGAAADRDELKARPDKDGFVQFSFRGQAWLDVLEWFAEISRSSLDWQELPADKLNLTTQRKYTVLETRDLLNRHLLSRGFTML
ncbi:MAG TPA: hypothetical protein PKC18_17120, partial [Lacipirellulaceae bacterium]|nr:hypothetical protein [Lacipirellulaceae bacterium]